MDFGPRLGTTCGPVQFNAASSIWPIFLKCLLNEILGLVLLSHMKKPLNTKKNPIYHFTICRLIPELQRFKDGQMSVICRTKKLRIQQNLSYD